MADAEQSLEQACVQLETATATYVQSSSKEREKKSRASIEPKQHTSNDPSSYHQKVSYPKSSIPLKDLLKQQKAQRHKQQKAKEYQQQLKQIQQPQQPNQQRQEVKQQHYHQQQLQQQQEQQRQHQQHQQAGKHQQRSPYQSSPFSEMHSKLNQNQNQNIFPSLSNYHSTNAQDFNYMFNPSDLPFSNPIQFNPAIYLEMFARTFPPNTYNLVDTTNALPPVIDPRAHGPRRTTMSPYDFLHPHPHYPHPQQTFTPTSRPHTSHPHFQQSFQAAPLPATFLPNYRQPFKPAIPFQPSIFEAKRSIKQRSEDVDCGSQPAEVEAPTMGAVEAFLSSQPAEMEASTTMGSVESLV